MIEHELVGGAVKLTTSGTKGVGAPVVGSSVVGLSLGCDYEFVGVFNIAEMN